MPSLPDILAPEELAFIQQGVSICVASRDVRHVPSLSRALGCRVTGNGQLQLLLVKTHSEALVRDLEKSAVIAVVFSRPSTHRTLQLKGTDAKVTPATGQDQGLERSSHAAFAAEIQLLGFPLAFTDRMFEHNPGDLCVVTFTPSDLFEQTPGPNAGVRVERSR